MAEAEVETGTGAGEIGRAAAALAGRLGGGDIVLLIAYCTPQSWHLDEGVTTVPRTRGLEKPQTPHVHVWALLSGAEVSPREAGGADADGGIDVDAFSRLAPADQPRLNVILAELRMNPA